MSIFRCRQLDREGTERNVEVAGADAAPGEYVDEYVRTIVGAVVFVEVLADGEWDLWEVERVGSFLGARTYMTQRTTREAARREIAENAS